MSANDPKRTRADPKSEHGLRELAPGTYCYFNRGNLYLTLGEYQKAISDFTAALGERRGDPLALTRRAQAYEAIGQKAQALDDFRAALGHCHLNRKFAGHMTMAATVHAVTVAWRHVSIA
jgi:tetratricopeptide (TPR) repeat protein